METLLKKELRLLGHTQKGAAKKMGVTEQTVFNICNGHKITGNMVAKLLKLGVPREVIEDPMREV